MKSQLKHQIACLVALAITFVAVNSTTAQVASPSKEHEVLNWEVGTWNMTSTMETPQGNMDFSGVEKNMMMNPMWLSSTLEYEAGGQKMNGHGVFGYDPHKKKYVGVWCDGASPYMSMLEGDWDEATTTFTYKMTGRDPMTGNDQNGQIIIKYDGKDKKTFTMKVENPEKKGELMEYFTMNYTKKK